jgi:hypothetical protein
MKPFTEPRFPSRPSTGINLRSELHQGSVVRVSSGTFPTSPKYGYLWYFSDSSCNNNDYIESILLDTCLTFADSGSDSFYKFSCGSYSFLDLDSCFFSLILVSGSIIQISYSDASCSTPNIGLTFPYLNTCSATPAISGTYFDYYRSSCSSSNPYKAYGNSTYYVAFRSFFFSFVSAFLPSVSTLSRYCSAYDSDSCKANEVIATNGYLNGRCLTYGVGSFKYAWPKTSYYLFSTSCRGTPTFKKTINTNCNSDSATFGASSFDTNLKVSQINPDSSSDDNSLSAGVIAGIVIGSFCGLAIIVAVISFFCRCFHGNRRSTKGKTSSAASPLPLVTNDAKMPTAIVVSSSTKECEYDLVHDNWLTGDSR